MAKLNASGTYILNAANQQITEPNGAGAWQHTNIYAPGGRLLATYDSSTQASPGYHFNLTDWLGTKRMQTTGGGNQQQTCMSYPFGDGLICSGGTDATEQHFTGKDRDVESGLDYFYARYYSSNLGRFMTPDWAGAPTAVPYANFGDPQSLNLYAYVGNNPNTGIDVDGHCCYSEEYNIDPASYPMNSAEQSPPSNPAPPTPQNSNSLTEKQVAEEMYWAWRFMPKPPTGLANKWVDAAYTFTAPVSATSPFEQGWGNLMDELFYGQSPDLQAMVCTIGCTRSPLNQPVAPSGAALDGILSNLLEPSAYSSGGSGAPWQDPQLKPNYTSSETLSPSLLAPGVPPGVKPASPAAYQKPRS